MDLLKPHSETPADRVVWDAFRQGSKLAFEYIYRQYIQELYRYGVTIHASDQLVKDTIQNLFIELWSQKSKLSSTDNIKYYLFKALRFKIYRELKSESYRNQQQGSCYENKTEVSIEAQLINTEYQKERKQKLDKALTKLPIRQKEVIHLLYSEELSYEQIAELMTINVASVYTLAWKALSALKRLMISWLLFICCLVG